MSLYTCIHRCRPSADFERKPSKIMIAIICLSYTSKSHCFFLPFSQCGDLLWLLKWGLLLKERICSYKRKFFPLRVDSHLRVKRESLEQMRKHNRLIMLYKGLKGAASITTNDLVPKKQVYQESSFPSISNPTDWDSSLKVRFLPPRLP